LQAAMEVLPQKVAKRGLRQAVRAGAPIQEAMISNATKDSGFLAEHIDVKTRVRKDELAASAFVGPNGRKLYPAENRRAGYWARTAAYVARMFEFGTSKRAKLPFMTQAFESHKAAALDKIIAKLRDVLLKD